MRHSKGEGWSPSESFLDNGHNVREIINVGMIWQPSTTNHAVELTMGRSHDIRVLCHCKEKTCQRSVSLRGSENGLLREATVRPMVSDIALRYGKEGRRW